MGHALPIALTVRANTERRDQVAEAFYARWTIGGQGGPPGTPLLGRSFTTDARMALSAPERRI